LRPQPLFGEVQAVVSRAAETIVRVPVPDLCTLWAEGPTSPMNIALIGVLDGAALTDQGGRLRVDVVRAHLAARLHRAPPLRRALRLTRFGQGLPLWVDAALDLADHVVPATPPGPQDEQSFLDWAAQRSTIALDRSRPLWRMDLVPGLPGGKVGMVLVAHHVVVDGLRGVALLAGLLDAEPAPALQPPPSWQPRPAPTAAELTADNLRRRARGVAAAVRRLPDLPARLHGLAALGSETRQRSASTSLAGPIGPGRRLAVVRRPMPSLRGSAHAAGVTINDLLLAAVTSGLRDLLTGRGECRDGLVLRASVPVGAHPGEAGGMLVVPLPVALADPAARLRLISAETRRRKQHADDGVAAVLSMPASLARLGVAWGHRAAARHIDLYVTNVPGPAAPLYLADARLLDAVPLAPLVAGVPLSVTALSYHDVLAVAVQADAAVTDLASLVSGIRRGFDELTGQNDTAARSTA
jgi:WS/DGAT/MGAT family acyltransferase